MTRGSRLPQSLVTVSRCHPSGVGGTLHLGTVNIRYQLRAAQNRVRVEDHGRKTEVLKVRESRRVVGGQEEDRSRGVMEP